MSKKLSIDVNLNSSSPIKVTKPNLQRRAQSQPDVHVEDVGPTLSKRSSQELQNAWKPLFQNRLLHHGKRLTDIDEVGAETMMEKPESILQFSNMQSTVQLLGENLTNSPSIKGKKKKQKSTGRSHPRSIKSSQMNTEKRNPSITELRQMLKGARDESLQSSSLESLSNSSGSDESCGEELYAESATGSVSQGRELFADSDSSISRKNTRQLVP